MPGPSNIEWTQRVWNPVAGCAILSPGCTNCYAMKMAHRLGANPATPIYHGLTRTVNGKPVWAGEMRLVESALDAPLHWRKPAVIFVNSMSDLFADGVPDAWIDRVFAVMALAPQHTFQLLTKRAERMRAYFDDLYAPTGNGSGRLTMTEVDHPTGRRKLIELRDWTFMRQPLPNLWLGISAEDQRRADERLPLLLATPAAKRFVSVEPMLGPVDLAWAVSRNRLDIAAGFLKRGHFSPGLETLRPLDSVIVGGESGPDARPMHPDWARRVRDDCAAAGAPFHFKQWGAFAPAAPHASLILEAGGSCEPYVAWPSGAICMGKAADHGGPGVALHHLGKKAAGRLLDGVEHNGGPW